MKMKPVLIPALFAALVSSPLMAQETTDDLFAQWDLNADGSISELEARTTLTTIFSTFDTNLDGYLDDDDEVADDQEDVVEDGEVAMDFDDPDGDGRVSMVEFVDRAGDWMALMDRDGDGVITAADFAA
jgi:Ca2+-binding EF-hand superfamily protein